MEDPDSPSWTIAYTTNAAPTERPPSPSWEIPSNPSTSQQAFAAPPASGNPYAPTSGGFFPSTASNTNEPLSPPPSSVTSSNHPALPHPRSHPLRPGGSKEATLRTYIDNRLLSISRRYVKKFAPEEPSQTTSTPGFGAGYKTFKEVARDFNEVIDVLWRSGTPSIQVPYFWGVALKVAEFVGGFEPARSATFKLVKKLDYCLASLVSGVDLETGEALPGFEDDESSKRWLSRTDVVRLKGILEGTRVTLFEVFSPPSRGNQPITDGEETETDVDMDRETDNETIRGEQEDDEDDEDDEENMDLARVYELSLTKIDEFLGRGTSYDIGDGPGAG